MALGNDEEEIDLNNSGEEIEESEEDLSDLSNQIMLKDGVPFLPPEGNQKIKNGSSATKNIDSDAIALNKKLGLTAEAPNSHRETQVQVNDLDIKNPSLIPLIDSSKKQETTIEISIKLPLIDKQLYNVLGNNFENGKEDISKILINGLNAEQLKESILAAINKHYSG